MEGLMSQFEYPILQRLEQLYRRRMSFLEMGSPSFIIRKDGTIEPSADKERFMEKAAAAMRLLHNYQALLLGPHSRFWWMQVPKGHQLYLSGKAKPSVGLRHQAEMEKSLEKFMADATPIFPPGVSVGSIDLLDGRWREML